MNEGLARDYEGFRTLLNDWRMELKLSMLELNHLAGLQSGYSEKLLSSTLRTGAAYQRNIGPATMGKILTALGVAIALVPATAGSISAEEKQTYQQVVLLRERARRGGVARFAKMTRTQQSELGRLGGIASARVRSQSKRGASKKKRPMTCLP